MAPFDVCCSSVPTFHDKISKTVSNFPLGKTVHLELMALLQDYRGRKQGFVADSKLKHDKRVGAMIARGMRWAAPTCI